MVLVFFKYGLLCGDIVLVVVFNVFCMYEVYFGVFMVGMIFNVINICLDVCMIVFFLEYLKLKVLIVDEEFFFFVDEVFVVLSFKFGLFKFLLLVVVEEGFGGFDWGKYGGFVVVIVRGVIEYECFFFGGDLGFVWLFFVDEWDLILLGYMFGMMSSFKGVFFFY